MIPFYASIYTSKAITVELLKAFDLNIFIPLLNVLFVSCIYIVIQFLKNRDIDKVILIKKCILRLSIAYTLLILLTFCPIDIKYFSYYIDTTNFVSLISDCINLSLLTGIGPFNVYANDNSPKDDTDWSWIDFDGGYAVGGADGEDDDNPGPSRSKPSPKPRPNSSPNPSPNTIPNSSPNPSPNTIPNSSAANATNTANATNAEDIPIVDQDRQVRISITQKWHRYVSDKHLRGDKSSITYRELYKNSGLTDEELRIMKKYITRNLSSNSNIVYGRNTDFQSKVKRFIDNQ